MGVRAVLALALLLHLSGLPAVAASPCAGAAGAAHACCMRQQADSGGATVGFCGCHLKSGSSGPATVVSTQAERSDGRVNPAAPSPAGLCEPPASARGQWHNISSIPTTDLGPSPPGSRLRC
jgi:hypothetical protein